jgi:hypothetical protein
MPSHNFDQRTIHLIKTGLCDLAFFSKKSSENLSCVYCLLNTGILYENDLLQNNFH